MSLYLDTANRLMFNQARDFYDHVKFGRHEPKYYKHAQFNAIYLSTTHGIHIWFFFTFTLIILEIVVIETSNITCASM